MPEAFDISEGNVQQKNISLPNNLVKSESVGKDKSMDTNLGRVNPPLVDANKQLSQQDTSILQEDATLQADNSNSNSTSKQEMKQGSAEQAIVLLDSIKSALISSNSGSELSYLFDQLLHSEPSLTGAIADSENPPYVKALTGLLTMEDHFFSHKRSGQERKDFRKVRSFIVDFLSSHVDELSKGFNPEAKNATIYAFLHILDRTKPDQLTDLSSSSTQTIDSVSQILEAHFSDVSKFINLHDHKVERANIIKILLNKGNNAIVDKSFDLLGYTDEFRLIKLCEYDLTYREFPRLGYLLNKLTEKYQLSGEELYQAWAISNKSESLAWTIQTNLHHINKIESEIPGSAKLLFQIFGIRDFGRYPIEMLLKQCREINDTHTPFGMIIYPRDDFNGAFYQNQYIFKQLSRQAEDYNYQIRIAEVNNARELVALLNRTRHHYRPISFALMAGHGTRNSIRLGKGQQDVITLKDLQKKGTESLQLALEPEAPIAFFSCSTGAQDGIAQNVALQLNTTTVAPEIDTFAGDVMLTKDDSGKLHLDVSYGWTSEGDDRITKKYQHGQEMKNAMESPPQFENE